MLSFAALPVPLASALLIAVAAVICALFLLRPPRPRLTVPSTLIWERVMGAARFRPRRRRWVVSLLLSLLIGLCLALAAARMQVGAPGRPIVIVLDNTVSMSARTADGRTRWDHAVAAAQDLIGPPGGAGDVLLLDTAARAAPTGFVPRREALDRLARMRPLPSADGRMPPLPVDRAIGATHLFTDGVAIGAVPAGVTVHSVYEAADNVGITGFEARPLPGAPTRYQAFLQIANTGSGTTPVSLEVQGSDGFRVSRELRLAADATANLTLDVTGVSRGVLRARIRSPRDAFALDDSAYCVVLPHRPRRVLLVTAGNALLEDSLRLLPGVALTVRGPGRPAAAADFDAYVFDRFAPPVPPTAGALLLRPPATPWLDAKWRTAGRTTGLAPDDTHFLAAGVAWGDVRLEKTWRTTAPTGRVVVALTRPAVTTGAVVLTGEARKRWVATGFALQDSNLPLQPGFPVFLGAVLDWLDPAPALTSAGVGWVEVPDADAEVSDGARRHVPTIAASGHTLFEATRPDVYVAESGGRPRMVVVNVNDPRMARINRQRLAGETAATRTPEVDGPSVRPEPGPLLLGLALLLLLAEWGAFMRGATE